MHAIVPEEWRDQLRSFVREHFDEDRDNLTATDFRHAVWLRFPDGSLVLFKYALYLISRDRNQIAVFTEHCGYHVFPLMDAQIELMQSVWTDVGTP